jgi:hypothetical protein
MGAIATSEQRIFCAGPCSSASLTCNGAQKVHSRNENLDAMTEWPKLLYAYFY